jgi:hypothetical protein
MRERGSLLIENLALLYAPSFDDHVGETRHLMRVKATPETQVADSALSTMIGALASERLLAKGDEKFVVHE